MTYSDSSIAARNRQIKKTLESAFGRGKVRVRGARGTGYGWVHVYIDHTPFDNDRRRELEQQCKALLRAAAIDLGRAYTDDDCQYEMDKCHISFNQCRYYQTMRLSDGSLAVKRDYDSDWEAGAITTAGRNAIG